MDGWCAWKCGPTGPENAFPGGPTTHLGHAVALVGPAVQNQTHGATHAHAVQPAPFLQHGHDEGREHRRVVVVVRAVVSLAEGGRDAGGDGVNEGLKGALWPREGETQGETG